MISSVSVPAAESAPAARLPSDGLRARKKRRRHDELVDAAQGLVLERGLDAVTVDDICEAVGVSPRTFFNYFASKDDAVLGLERFEAAPEVAATFVAGGPSGTLLDDVAHLVAHVLGLQVVTPERLHRGLELVQREPRLLARHVARIEEHRAEMVELFAARRLAHPYPADPELLALVVMGLLRMSALEWQRAGGEGSPADRLPGVVDQLRSLLEPDPPG